VRRALIAGTAALAIVALAYVLFLRSGSAVAPRLVSSRPVASIGSGSNAVAVAEDGTILTWVTSAGAETLPRLPLESPPKGPRIKGSALEQVRILAATPPALLPYVESSYFGETGVDVELASGIELRFGNASEATRKWKAAAAVLASPEVTALDYVDLHAPGHPDVGGSGHALPPVP
jgi:hypothetical protein